MITPTNDGNPEGEDVPASTELEAEVRQALTGYAERVPHHGLDCLGDAVRVSSAEEILAYRTTLRTLYESRSYEALTRPHRGEPIPPATTTEATIDPWSYRLEAHADFTRLEHRYPIDETQEVRPCDDCSSAGRVTCPGCRGQARVTCDRCEGQRLERCRICCGSGRAYARQTTQVTEHCSCSPVRRRDCWTCRGTGIVMRTVNEGYPVPCAACAATGRITCQLCLGDGILTCKDCCGRGDVTCGTCDGQRRVVRYLEVVQVFSPHDDEGRVVDGPCPGPIARAVDGSADFAEYAAIDRPTIKPASPLPVRSAALEAVVRGLIADSRSRVLPRRIIRQRLTIAELPLAHFAYSHENRAYEGWLVGPHRLPEIPANPVTARLREKLAESLSLWRAKRRFAAASRLAQVYAMAGADRFCAEALKGSSQAAGIPTALRLLARRRGLGLIAATAKWGALFGGVGLPLLSLAYLGFAFLGDRPPLARPGSAGLDFRALRATAIPVVVLASLAGGWLIRFWHREDSPAP